MIFHLNQTQSLPNKERNIQNNNNNNEQTTKAINKQQTNKKGKLSGDLFDTLLLQQIWILVKFSIGF